MFLDSDVLFITFFWGMVFFGLFFITTCCFSASSYLRSIWSFIFCKKKLNSSRNGGQLVAEVLKAHNVHHIFTLTGGHISPILVAAEESGIRVIDTRQEVTAVFAADAVSRLTGNIGVAVVTAGPGVTNTITAIKNAQMAQSAVLLIGGAAPTLLKGRGSLQDMDQMALFESLCKYCASIKTLREIVPVLRKSIHIAMSDTPGPVFVEIPVNVLYPLNVVEKELLKSKARKSLLSRFINWFVEWQVYNIFFDGFEPRPTDPLPVRVPVASNKLVKLAGSMLQKSRKPVIVFGSQAMLPPSSSEDLKAAVIALGVPCFLAGMSRGLLGRNYPLHLRHTRKEVLKEADLVILAGATCDFRLSYGKVLSKNSLVIAVNRNKKEMLKNSDIFWKSNLSVVGCVSNFIIRLKNETENQIERIDRKWVVDISERDIAREAENRMKAQEMPQTHLNPLKVLYDLDESLGDNSDTIFIADGGDFVATASYIIRPQGPLRWLDPGPFGTLGVGAGFALGAKLSLPDKKVVILYGDGSLGYSLIEFDTFVRHELPIYSVVGNDASWTQIARDQVKIFGSNVACQLRYCNYNQIAESLGGKGLILNSTNTQMLKELFKQVFEEAEYEGTSVLINAIIEPSSFRDGSLSV